MKVMLKKNAFVSPQKQEVIIERFTKLNYSADNGQKRVLFRLADKKEELQETGYIIRSGGLPQIAQPIVPVTISLQQQGMQMSEIQEINTIEFPDIVTEKFSDVGTKEDEDDMKPIDLRYPLIPRDPKGGKVFAYAHIFYDQKANQLLYNVIEPPLDDKLKRMVESIKAYVQEKIDINFSQVKNKDAESYITKLIDSALIHFRHSKKDSYDTIRYYILRDFIGLEVIEPLVQDQNIEDVSCDGVGIPIFVYHRDPRIGSVKTNIAFNDRDQLDTFAIKLAERCGKSLSVAKPLLDGPLPTG